MDSDLWSDFAKLYPDMAAQPVPPTPSRMDVVRQKAGEALDALMPFSAMKNPDTPEARAAYDVALKRGPGKIQGAPGAPVFSPMQGGLLDVASALAPVGKAAAGMVPAAARGVTDEGISRLIQGLREQAPAAAPNTLKDLAWQNLGLPQDGMARRYFEQYLGDPDKFLRNYYAGMHDPTSNLNSFLFSRTPSGKPVFDISAGLLDPATGDELGWARRILKPATGEAEHDYLKFGPGVQDKGYGKKLVQSQIAAYPDMGINKVKMFANVDVGGYSWAKYGWLPEQEDWDALRGDIRKHLNGQTNTASGQPNLKLPNITPADRRELGKILQDNDPRAIWDLADLDTDVGAKDARGKPAPLGKALLLGKDWNGTLDLRNPEQMERFNGYTSQ